MAKDVKKKPLLLAALMLAGCAATKQQPEMKKLHNQVSKLNTEMQQLTQQAASLEQQNMLNSTLNMGAWLLPATKTAVALKSQAGEVHLYLSQIEGDVNGTRAILHIRSAVDHTLPAFTVQVEWGEIDPTTGKPLRVDSQSQSLTIKESLLARSEIIVPLRLSHIAPEQLGYIRVHDIVSQDPPKLASAP